MKTIGIRLKEEREKLNLSQAQISTIGGMRKQAQMKYELGDSFPNAQYLSELAKIGVDVQYVITGIHSTQNLSNDESELLSLFQRASLELKAAAIGMLKTGNTASTGANKQVFYGSVGQRIEGDSHGAVINMGTGSVTATTNTKTKKKNIK